MVQVDSEDHRSFPRGAVILGLYLIVYTIIAGTGFLPAYTAYYKDLVWWLIAALMLYFYVERYMPGGRAKERRNQRLKIGIVLVLCILLIVVPLIAQMILRTDESCKCYVHDSLLQNELVVRLVVQGRNPYEAEFKGTRLESWRLAFSKNLENPALYHYTYLPVTFLLPLPFQMLSEELFDWFDQRVIYLVAYLAVLAFCIGFRISANRKTTLLIALGLNPFLAFLLVPGYNDILVLFWVVLCVYALRFERPYLSAIALGLACATKQYAWFFVPFYFYYLGGQGDFKERLGRAWRPVLLFCLVFGLFTLPWVIDNPHAFVQDVLGYHTGIVEHSYPINGLSLTSLLYGLGIIEKVTDNFPSYIIQLVFGLPLLVILLLLQRRENSLRRAMLSYAILIAEVIFFARAGNINHWGFVISIYALSLLVKEPHEVPAYETKLVLERGLQKARDRIAGYFR
jgi:Gpi18-like mannosyltransferase